MGSVVHRYPALVLSALFAAGIGIGFLLDGSGLWISAAIAGCMLAGSICTRWMGGTRMVSPAPLARTVMLFSAVVAIGVASYSLQVTVPQHHVAHHVGTSDEGHYAPDVVYGNVRGAPHLSDQQLRFVVELDSLSRDGHTHLASGSVQVTHWHRSGSTAVADLTSGDRVSARGTLEPPPRPRNPADMDYGRYLVRQGIFAVITVENFHDIQHYGSARSLRDRFVVPARVHIDQQVSRYVPSENAGHVLRALLLADRSGIDTELRDQFVRTGLMHLLAVSGLHVLLVGLVLYRLLQPTLLRLGFSWTVTETTRAGITMAVLVFYMLLTEARPSVVRAVVMAGLFIGGSVLQRSSQSLNTLGVAALVLLIIRPTQLFDVGFQLSFSAVAAILLINPPLQRWLTSSRPDAWWNGVATIFTTTVAATIGTLPVLLVHFGFASLAGLLLNIAAIPLTALGLSSGLLTVLIGPAWSGLAHVMGHAADVSLNGLLLCASIGDQLFSWAAIEGGLSFWMGGALLASVAAGLSWSAHRRRWRFVLVALFCLVMQVWIGVAQRGPQLDVIFLDVGQGDAALVKLPDGGHALFDAGLRNPFVDSGERTILPHLAHFGIDRLEAVVISHPHSDHLGGLPSILRSVPVDTVYRNGDQLPTQVYDETNHLLDSLDVSQRVVRVGDTIPLGKSVHAQVLYPTEAALNRRNANDASVVVRLTFGETSFLFLGDAEREAERDLLAHFAPLMSADVVKVGHHGSSTSSKRALVQWATANTARSVQAIVSAGANNRYGLPNESVLGRWHRKGANVHSTATSGARWFRSDGRSVREIHWR